MFLPNQLYYSCFLKIHVVALEKKSKYHIWISSNIWYATTSNNHNTKSTYTYILVYVAYPSLESFEFKVTRFILMERDKVGNGSGKKNHETVRQYFDGERKGRERETQIKGR